MAIVADVVSRMIWNSSSPATVSDSSGSMVSTLGENRTGWVMESAFFWPVLNHSIGDPFLPRR